MTLSFHMECDDPLYLLVDLYYLHKSAPEQFGTVRKELFTKLYKSKASPEKFYSVMVCFIVAKAPTMEEAATLYSLISAGSYKSNTSEAFNRYLEENPSSLEARQYDV